MDERDDYADDDNRPPPPWQVILAWLTVGGLSAGGFAAVGYLLWIVRPR